MVRLLRWNPMIMGSAARHATRRAQHLRGVSDTEQRQYEHILEGAIKSGRYGSRAKEVAARTVLKRHKERGHRRGR
jgi:hypothetical protein